MIWNYTDKSELKMKKLSEDELKSYLKRKITSKDVILIKGSRGMRMERFIDV